MKRTGLIFAGVTVLFALVFVSDHRLWLIDDRNHPDGVLLADEFAAARAENRGHVNVIAVNGGNWLALCLSGPGTDPQAALLEFGRKARVRVPTLQRVRSWLYAGHVPANEMALVLVTERYSVRSRRLPNLTQNTSFRSACALRNDAGLTWR